MDIKVEVKYILAGSRTMKHLITYISDFCLPYSSLGLLGKQHQVQSKENNSLLLFCPEQYQDLFNIQERGRGNLLKTLS